MAFTATLNLVDGEAHITLTGELDRLTAVTFQQQVTAAVEAKATRLVIFAKELEYMASAGLRVLLFAKQKMGTGVDIYFVAANEDVLDTLNKTGLA
ncbi:MAG: anti-sigma factor antagonist, partial [Microcystaceae cyanobacterium]